MQTPNHRKGSSVVVTVAIVVEAPDDVFLEVTQWLTRKKRAVTKHYLIGDRSVLFPFLIGNEERLCDNDE